MKKIIINLENPEGTLVDLTAEEITLAEQDKANSDAKELAEQTAKTEKENLKASAKAKLIAGEPLTEDEANTIVL